LSGNPGKRQSLRFPAFSFLLRKEDQLASVSIVQNGETIMASYVTGSRVTGSYVTSSATPSAAARAFKWLGLITAMTVYCYSLPLRAMEETLVVTIDQARVVKVPPGTETLIVGNAAIADLTLLKQGGAIVTGKGFGETNFIALDGAGNPLAQSLIRVVAAEMPCLCSAVWTANPIPARRNVYQPRSLATMPNILAMSRDR